MQLLTGHTSPETAYVVDDYPYGFRLRCKIRYWLEFAPKRGFRLVSQTTNPKRQTVIVPPNAEIALGLASVKVVDFWNKPKASTYCRFGGAMYLDQGRVEWSGLTEYSTAAEAVAWRDRYGVGVPSKAGRALLDSWVAAKVNYEAKQAAATKESSSV